MSNENIKREEALIPSEINEEGLKTISGGITFVYGKLAVEYFPQ